MPLYVMFTKKILLAFTAIVMATALVWATSDISKMPQPNGKGASKEVDQYWVLKSGRSISTTPSDYQLGGSPCSGSAEFCGFHAPENGSTDEPVISGNTETDLENLSEDPETPSNVSGKISYEN